MIHRIFPTKDTWITNVQRNRVQQTGSNFGAAETLDLFKLAGVSGTIGVAGSASISRLLLQFDFSSIAALTASGLAPTSGISYMLRLRHVTTPDTLPTSYDVTIHPVSAEWDEGRGLDVEEYRDKGYANWVKPRATTSWASGSNFSTSNTASVHFDDGLENLEADVTNMVNAWLVSGSANNGLLVKLTGTIESDSDFTDYYIKKFYSRTSGFKDRRPYIEARWNDSLRDDRGRFAWNRTGSLFLYNSQNDALTNLSIGTNTLKVAIVDASGTLFTLTGSFVGQTGLYSASFAIPTGSYSGSVFHDVWYSGSSVFMTGTLFITDDVAQQTIGSQPYIASFKNLADEYDPSDEPRLNVIFKKRSSVPTVVLTASNSSTPDIPFKAYYAVENDATRERVIQFGTGSSESTRLSHDLGGNYFRFRMANLHAGNVYRMLLLVDDKGVRQVIDNGFKFKIL